MPRDRYLIIANADLERLRTAVETTGGEVRVEIDSTLRYGRSESCRRIGAGTLSEFDIVVFHDCEAVSLLIDDFEHGGVDLFELDCLTVCTLGSVVADELRFHQIHADIIPTKLTAGAVTQALTTYLSNGLDGLQHKILLVRSSADFRKIASELSGSGGEVTELAWEAIPDREAGPNLTMTKALLLGGGFEGIVFGTARDLSAFETMFSCAAEELLSETFLLAGDELTAAALAERGLACRVAGRRPHPSS